MRNFKKFERSDLPKAADFYQKYFRELSAQAGWKVVLCPFHEDRNPSLSINLDRGNFKCFACGESGGDVLDFYRKIHNVCFKKAAQALDAWGK